MASLTLRQVELLSTSGAGQSRCARGWHGAPPRNAAQFNGYYPYSLHCVRTSFHNYLFTLSDENPRGILAAVVDTISRSLGSLCYYPGFW